MNKQQEKDIIRTLVKAGHETLAKSFAQSRGYGVRVLAADKSTYTFTVVSRDSPPPKKEPFYGIDYMAQKRPKDELHRKTVKMANTLDLAMKATSDRSFQNQMMKKAQSMVGSEHLVMLRFSVQSGSKNYVVAEWDFWKHAWFTPYHARDISTLPAELQPVIESAVKNLAFKPRTW